MAKTLKITVNECRDGQIKPVASLFTPAGSQISADIMAVNGLLPVDFLVGQPLPPGARGKTCKRPNIQNWAGKLTPSTFLESTGLVRDPTVPVTDETASMAEFMNAVIDAFQKAVREYTDGERGVTAFTMYAVLFEDGHEEASETYELEPIY